MHCAPDKLRPASLKCIYGIGAALLLLLSVALLVVSCQNADSPPAQKEEPPSSEIPEPRMAEQETEPEPRYDDDGVLKQATATNTGAPVPSQARSTLSNRDTDRLELAATAEEVQAFLEKHYPDHEISRLRGGEAFKAVPRGDGPLIMATWVNDRYRMTVIEQKPAVEEVRKPSSGTRSQPPPQ